MSEREWGHDELAEDLSASRRKAGKIAFTRISIGSFGTHGQMDVLVMEPSWTKTAFDCYEVKVSRSDFLGDIGSGKYLRYRPFCNRLVFATPKGMVSKDELPNGCGLVVRNEKSWRTVRRGTVENMKPEDRATALQSIVFRAADAPWRKSGDVPRPERIRRLLGVLDEREWLALRYESQALGKRVAGIIHQAEEAIHNHDRARLLLAQEVGLTEEEVDGHSVAEIARRVLQERPERKAPTGLIVNDINRALLYLENAKQLAGGVTP